jgi:hypothetical protein
MLLASTGFESPIDRAITTNKKGIMCFIVQLFMRFIDANVEKKQRQKKTQKQKTPQKTGVFCLIN